MKIESPTFHVNPSHIYHLKPIMELGYIIILRCQLALLKQFSMKKRPKRFNFEAHGPMEDWKWISNIEIWMLPINTGLQRQERSNSRKWLLKVKLFFNKLMNELTPAKKGVSWLGIKQLISVPQPKHNFAYEIFNISYKFRHWSHGLLSKRRMGDWGGSGNKTWEKVQSIYYPSQYWDMHFTYQI